MRQDFLKQICGKLAIGRKIALDYRDGARENHAVPTQDAFHVSLQRQPLFRFAHVVPKTAKAATDFTDFTKTTKAYL
jgi:hypothetical protein